MNPKKYVLPWQEKHAVFVPKCRGTIEVVPLVPGEEAKYIALLENTYGIKIDAELLAKLPRLSEADCASRQKWLAFLSDLSPFVASKTNEEILHDLFVMEDGIPAICVRHGIFPMLRFFDRTTLEGLFLLLSLERNAVVKPSWFMKTMELSAASVSGILKSLKKRNLILDGSVTDLKLNIVEGRARSRQRFFFIWPKVREILDRDLQNHNFFRTIVIDFASPVAKRYPDSNWRKDLFGTNN